MSCRMSCWCWCSNSFLPFTFFKSFETAAKGNNRHYFARPTCPSTGFTIISILYSYCLHRYCMIKEATWSSIHHLESCRQSFSPTCIYFFSILNLCDSKSLYMKRGGLFFITRKGFGSGYSVYEHYTTVHCMFFKYLASRMANLFKSVVSLAWMSHWNVLVALHVLIIEKSRILKLPYCYTTLQANLNCLIKQHQFIM
jgi:hypothetical protein